MFLLITSDC